MKDRCPSTRIAFVLAVATLLAAGCGGGGGGNPVKVEGKVTLDGNPVSDVTIVFMPEDGKGQRATGRSVADGTFRLTTRSTGDGAVPGNYKVTVRKEMPGIAGAGMDPKSPEYFKKMQDMAKNKDRRVTGPTNEVHPNYADDKKTTLKYEIPSGGTTDLEIKLNKQGS